MNDLDQLIAALSPLDALSVLKTLAREDEKLAARIVEIASRQLKQIDYEEVAESVYADLEGLEVEKIWDRSGKTRHGYVDPGEAASEMVDEALQPYLDEIQKCQKLGLTEPARCQCLGLILGLFEFETESTSKFKDWYPDFSMPRAQEALLTWKQGFPSVEDLAAMKKALKEEGLPWKLKVD